jgi:hypothetical protein
MVGAFEKVMNRVSEWLAKEWKEKEQEEDDKKERSKWSIEREKKKAGRYRKGFKEAGGLAGKGS